ncbi:hypothetical protein [Bifidobacterium margollesii]|nr:hypothetical protein [Bifidobacterium margollesii]
MIEPWAAPVARRIAHGLTHIADDLADELDETCGRDAPDPTILPPNAWLRPLGDGSIPEPEGCIAALDIGENRSYLLALPAGDPDVLAGIMIAAAALGQIIENRYGVEPCGRPGREMP